LTKALTTLGRPGVQVAAITRRAEGYLEQLSQRKKLLKSLTSLPQLSVTLLALFGTEGFLFYPLRAALFRSFQLHVLSHLLGKTFLPGYRDCHPEANHEVRRRISIAELLRIL
jgi:hypothetical protein